MKPAFLITIDTEGDNLWTSTAGPVSVENGRYLPRFQNLCEKYGFLPTYLTDYDMGRSPVFLHFAEETLKRGTCEIGMHLHAWSTPPAHPLDSEVRRPQPYLIEYPDEVMEEKIDRVTHTLRSQLGSGVVAHRAGRWAMDERYLRMLVNAGYSVDCSVTPGVALKPSSPASPLSPRGYERFPESAYEPSLSNFRRSGSSGLLELPVTIGIRRRAFKMFTPLLPGKLSRRLLRPLWLRPNGENLEDMLKLVRCHIASGADYLEFMIHSSELMPGGSPYFSDHESVERLYLHLETLFSQLKDITQGMTLSGYRNHYFSSLSAKEPL